MVFMTFCLFSSSKTVILLSVLISDDNLYMSILVVMMMMMKKFETTSGLKLPTTKAHQPNASTPTTTQTHQPQSKHLLVVINVDNMACKRLKTFCDVGCGEGAGLYETRQKMLLR